MPVGAVEAVKSPISPAATAAAHARASPEIRALADVERARSACLVKLGMAIALRIPIITSTIISSTSVKPACSLLCFLVSRRRWNRERWASSLALKRGVMVGI